MPTWSVGLHADDLVGDLVVDIVNGLQHTLAEIAGLVAVPQFQCFALAGGCSGRDCGPSHAPSLKKNLDLQGRIPAGIEDFPGVNISDLTHYCPLVWRILKSV